jgi:hypothetical protein
MPEQHTVLLAWDPTGEPVTVSTPDDVDEQLRGLHTRLRQAGTPTLVVLEREDEQTSLAIGLGADAAMASWLDDDGTEDLVSLGDGNDDELVAFLCAGAESEYPTSVSIDLEDALTAARAYASNGLRPANLNWQRI